MKSKFAPLLAIILVFALIFGFAGCSLTEDDTESTSEINIRTPLPTDITSSLDENRNVVTDTEYSPEALKTNTAEIFKYFTAEIAALKSGKAAVSMSERNSLNKATDENGDSIAYSENEYLNAAFTGLKKYFTKNTDDSMEYGSGIYDFAVTNGESYLPDITAAEVESATCADEGAVRRVTVKLVSPVPAGVAEKAAAKKKVQYMLDEFAKAEKYLTVEEPTLTYKEYTIILTINVETDEITQIRCEKSIDAAMNVTGRGELASIGTAPVNFNYHSEVTYDFNYEDPATSTTLAEM